MIGYTTPDDRELFVIAEIKNIRKQANGNYRVGLEVLGSNSMTVKLRRLDQNNFADALSGNFVNDTEDKLSQVNTFSGLLFDSQDDNKSLKASIVMPRSEYKRGNKLILNIEGDEKVVEMVALLSKKQDCARGFECLGLIDLSYTDLSLSSLTILKTINFSRMVEFGQLKTAKIRSCHFLQKIYLLSCL